MSGFKEGEVLGSGGQGVSSERYTQYDPKVRGIQRVCTRLRPPHLVPSPDDVMGQIGERLRRAQELGGRRDAYLVLNNKNGIFGELRGIPGPLHVAELTIDHPTQGPITDLPFVSPSLTHVVRVSYGADGKPARITIVPLEIPREDPKTPEESIERVREYIERELVLARAGVILRPEPMSGIIVTQESIDRFMGMSMSPVKAVPQEGQPTKAEVWENQLLETLYPGIDNEEKRRQIKALFASIGFDKNLERLEETVIEHVHPEDQQRNRLPAKIIHPLAPKSSEELIQELFLDLKVRRELWSRQYTWEFEMTDTGVAYRTGRNNMLGYFTPIPYGQRIPAQLTKYGQDTYSYEFAIQRHEGEDKLYIAIYLDGKFAYRIAFSTQVDVAQLTQAFKDTSSNFLQFSRVAEYSTNPLHNILA